MREIKFRAWDKEIEKMYPVLEIDFVEEWVRMYSKITGRHCNHLDDLVLMQFTGLEDKNGVEIYEGDIVHFKTLRGKEYIGKVKSYEDAASFFVVVKEHYMECLDAVYDLEVLGNIYENKELLE